MTYDHWKTTEPDDGAERPDYDEEAEAAAALNQCDCCGKLRVLSRCWAFGIETYACDECRGAEVAR
jgi:hypothetical protein